MPGAGIAIRSLRKSFERVGAPAIPAIDGITLDILAGEFVIVVGHNGSGKSTLLALLFGDLIPDAGRVDLVLGQSVEALTGVSRRQRARFMARVHQDPAHGTVPSLTLWENLRLADPHSWACPWHFGSATRARDEYGQFLEPLGLIDKLDARASELSAGQRQLAALLLALQRRPLVLLLDEHTALLDAQNARLCMDKAVELSRLTGTTVVAVTHDLTQALSYGDRLVVLRDGQIRHQADTKEKQELGLERLLHLCGYGLGSAERKQEA